jgi:hypothetical protein
MVAAALLIACVVTGLTEAQGLAHIRPIYDTRQVAARITPSDVLYTDPLTRKALEFHWKYPESTRLADFEGLGAEAVPSGSYVLLDTHRLRWLDANVSMWLTKDYGYHEPAFAKTRPASWKPLWRNPYATLYRVE